METIDKALSEGQEAIEVICLEKVQVSQATVSKEAHILVSNGVLSQVRRLLLPALSELLSKEKGVAREDISSAFPAIHDGHSDVGSVLSQVAIRVATTLRQNKKR